LGSKLTHNGAFTVVLCSSYIKKGYILLLSTYANKHLLVFCELVMLYLHIM